MRPGSVIVTSAVIYRQLAAEIGRLPEGLVKRVIEFYATVEEINRIVEFDAAWETTASNLVELAPRLRVAGEFALFAIEKLRQANYASDASVEPTSDEARLIAKKAGFPLSKVLAEHGLA